MGRLLLVYRLAVRDLRRHAGQAALLVLVIAATTTTLTLALVLHGVTDNPWNRTFAATDGPDAVALNVQPTSGPVHPPPGPTSSGRPSSAKRRLARQARKGDMPRQTAPASPSNLAAAPPKSLTALAHAAGVTGSSGPYPTVNPDLQAHGTTIPVFAEGR